MPYGSKSREAVTGFVTEVVHFLSAWNPQAVVLACNTATAMALPAVRAAFPHLNITGVIDPGASAAVEATREVPAPRIGVLATEGTCRSGAYERAIGRLRPEAHVLSQPAPLLAPMIEEGRDGADPMVRLAVQGYLAPLKDAGIDALVLGCTHYPLLRDLIVEMMDGLPVVDGGSHCGQDVARRLASKPVAHRRGALHGPHRGTLQCWVTDDSAKFGRLASRFLGESIPKVSLVRPEALAAELSKELPRQTALRRAV